MLFRNFKTNFTTIIFVFPLKIKQKLILHIHHENHIISEHNFSELLLKMLFLVMSMEAYKSL